MKRVTTTLIDDLDGSATEDVATVTFAFEGKSYEIDLTEENANELEQILGVYIRNGRRVASPPSAAARRAKKLGPSQQTSASDNPLIRLWARDKGIEIGDRGRIPAEVTERYYREAGK